LFPDDPDLSRDRDVPQQPAPCHPHIERDFGPDLGIGL
jgi:hypothetical protein